MRKLQSTPLRAVILSNKLAFEFLRDPNKDTLNRLCLWHEFDRDFGTQIFLTVWPTGSGSFMLQERSMEAIRKFWEPLSTQSLLEISDSHGVIAK